MLRKGSYPWRVILATSTGTSYWLFRTAAGPDEQFSARYSRFIGLWLAFWTVQSLVYALWVVFLYPLYFSPLVGKFPEPAGSSFWNGQFNLIRQMPSGEPALKWVNETPNNGILRYRFFLNQERLLVVGPKAMSELLVQKCYEFEKPKYIRSVVGRITGIGILLAEAEEHKFQRRNLLPAFSFRHVKDLYPVFWSKSCEGVHALTDQILAEASASYTAGTDKSRTALLEAGSWASRITLDIIGVAGMGRDFGAIQDPSGALCQAYLNIFKPTTQAVVLQIMATIIPPWIVFKLPVSHNANMSRASAEVRSVCRDLLRDKKARLARKEPSELDILSVAMESGGFTDENLVDQMMTFLAAGHETTANSMVWAIYLLCRHPEAQARLRQEVRENLPSPDDPSAVLSPPDVDRLPYLNAVVAETLRFYPPVPMVVREAAVDTSLLGVPVPRGTPVLFCPWATNKDKSLWGEDAFEFRPERWIGTGGLDPEKDRLAAAGGASTNYAFSTFIHGPRSCIGMSFAKAEFAVLLATWIGRMDFVLDDQSLMDEKNLEIKGGITARPAKGMHVRATVLEGW